VLKCKNAKKHSIISPAIRLAVEAFFHIHPQPRTAMVAAIPNGPPGVTKHAVKTVQHFFL
jgi:hypothetical protein